MRSIAPSLTNQLGRGRLHKTLLTLVDCILRSTSTSDDQVTISTAADLLGQLATFVSSSSQLENGQILSDLCELRDLAASASQDTESPDAWNGLLRRLSTSGDSSDEWTCVRQAAHTALRLRQLQSRFVENLEREKREAIYQLAYGLSHELNNPLANIASRAGLLLQSTDHPDQIQLLNAIADSAMRGCEMLGDLMLTARPPRLQLATVDLAQLKDVFLERGLRWTAARQILFELSWDANGSGSCQLDRSMLCEIVWSVLRNAIEASSAGGTVRVTVEKTNSELRVRVEDDGPGLSQQAMQHCFDPYYSGREAGRGLGLGLTKAKRLAELHGGDVKLENRVGRGCRATIWVATS